MIELEVVDLIVPQGYVLTSITWAINEDRDMAGVSIPSVTGLIQPLYLNYDFTLREIIYAQATVVFTNGVITNSEVSDVIALTDDCNTSNSDIKCYAPDIEVVTFKPNNKSGPKLTCKITNPRFFRGTANWIATTWRVLDHGGNVTWSREKDTENKTNIKLDSKNFSHLNLACLECEYVFDVKVDAPKAFIYVVLDSNDYKFNIDKKVINGSESVVNVNVVNTEYVVQGVTWRTIDSNLNIVQQGTGDIILNGVLYNEYTDVTLIVTLSTKYNGFKQGEFTMYVRRELATLPLPLPLPLTP